jgi:SAM-dependent methyltransferase
MASPHRQLAFRLLNRLRQSSLRHPIIKFLVKNHNFSYHWISFFASYSGTHPKHNIIKYHQFFLDNISPTDNVIDLGCGTGEVAFKISKKAAHVTGIDFSPTSIKQAQSNYVRDNLTFTVQDITTMDKDTTYNVAILSNVLEHIDDRHNFLLMTKALANKILIRVPLLTRDWLAVFKKEHGFEYRLDHTHFIEYSKQSFRQEIEKAQLHIDHLHINFGELYAVCKPAKPTANANSTVARHNTKQVAY